MTLTAVQRLEVYPNGNAKSQQLPEVLAAHERLAGRDPRELSVAAFVSIGYEPRPLIARQRLRAAAMPMRSAALLFHRCGGGAWRMAGTAVAGRRPERLFVGHIKAPPAV